MPEFLLSKWMTIIVLPLVTAFIVTFLAIPKIIRFSRLTRLFASSRSRDSHVGKIPILGGIGIFAGILFSLLLWGFNYHFFSYQEDLSYFESLPSILVSLSIVFIIGVIDDLLSLSAYKKLLGQISSILVIIFLGDLVIDNMQGVFGVFVLPDIFSIFFTIFVVVVITNSYNLIDGIDGLAGGLGFISCSIFGIIFMINNDVGFSILAFGSSGSLLAFLRYNFNPATIFMGDTGSLVVGLILSILAIRLINTGVNIPYDHFYKVKGPFAAIVILAVPLFDTFRIFFIRFLSGYNPLQADRNHIHHVLLDLGLGHKVSTITLYIFSLIIVFFSYFIIDFKQSLAIFILAIVVLGLMSIPFLMSHMRDRE